MPATSRRARPGAAWAWLLAALACPAQAATLKVGPHQPIRHISEAAKLAKDGDVVEVEAGDYRADVAVWRQRRLILRGVGGRPRLFAAGANAEGKGIWVIRGGQVEVENFTFIGARVADRNGAGIRFESGKLAVRRCEFIDNQMGILTNNEGDAELSIEDSEFGPNGDGEAINHNLYVGRIAKLEVRGSYFHHAKVGHLLKSRAAYSVIAYNRLTDEEGGQASYELEFPVGGAALVLGNLIEQSATTQNPKIIAYGAEGYRLPGRNYLFLVNNTIIDKRPWSGQTLFVGEGGGARVTVVNNLLAGAQGFVLPEGAVAASNHQAAQDELADPARYDYRLSSRSALLGQAVWPGEFEGVSLAPVAQYRHPMQTQPIPPGPLQPGAMQTVAP